MKIILPTHFRFKNEEEAKTWHSDTSHWHTIKEITHDATSSEISSTEFAWVTYDRKEDNLEFDVRPTFICYECDNELVDKAKQLCESCQDEKDAEEISYRNRLAGFIL